MGACQFGLPVRAERPSSLAQMEGEGMAEGEGDGAPLQGRADLGRPGVGRGPQTARKEVGGQEGSLPGLQGGEAVVEGAEAEYSEK